MPIAALRDPANETPPAASLGLAGCEGAAGAMVLPDFRAILIGGAPVGG